MQSDIKKNSALSHVHDTIFVFHYARETYQYISMFKMFTY